MAERSSDIVRDGTTGVAAGEQSDSMKKYDDERSQSVSEMQSAANEDLNEFSQDEEGQETEQIKVEIEETRVEMGQTIDAIQDRLSYANISEQVSEQVNSAYETAKDSVYDATIGKAVKFMKNAGNEISETSVVKTIKNNPIPIGLIGIGSGLLIYNSFGKKSDRSSKYALGSRSADHYADDPYTPGKKHNGVVDKVSSSAGTAFDGVSNAASSTYTGARDMANKAYAKAGEIGHLAQDKYNQYIEEQPLAVGAVALAVGAAVGFAIPSTRYENELMGEARGDLLTKAEETATEYMDKAKQVASDAGTAVKKEVNSAMGSSASQR